MREYKEIETLIEQYYNGETSLEEELQLQTFFEGEDIPDHLRSYQDQFIATKEMANIKSSILDNELFAKLEKQAVVVEMKPSKTTWLYRVAAGIALVVAGAWVGTQLKPDSGISEIQAQLDDMKEIMFEQLKSNSASGRLQAVSNTMVFEEADDETVDILIATLRNDKSIHVRSKAAQALVKFSASDKVKKALRTALLEESDPAVQIALIEGLVSLKEKSSIDVLQQLSENDNVLEDVKDEAHLGIFRLKEL